MSDPTDGGEDYIYRGENSTPQDDVQDGVPSNVTPPPPTPEPPGPIPTPNVPPPGFPPPQPPPGHPTSGELAPAKKKRWPWIVAAVVVFCALPLGGCVALIGFGVSELNQRSDDINATVIDFVEAAQRGDLNEAEGLTDGQPPCMSAEYAVQTVAGLGGDAPPTIDSTAFVERSGNSYLSSNADPETLFIDGRPDGSIGVVQGQIDTRTGPADFEAVLSKPPSSWRICTIMLR